MLGELVAGVDRERGEGDRREDDERGKPREGVKQVGPSPARPGTQAREW
ncbi:hypothetical protein [Streptomyces sp. NPDC058255]